MREISGLAKFGYFCVGLFAWFGCLFWLIVWVIMVVTGGIATFLAFLF